MANEIHIEPRVLRNAANQLNKAISMLDTASSQVESAANGVEEAWQSQITASYVARVREIKDRIEKQVMGIESLQRNLRNIADTVEQTEQKVSNIIQTN